MIAGPLPAQKLAPLLPIRQKRGFCHGHYLVS